MSSRQGRRVALREGGLRRALQHAAVKWEVAHEGAEVALREGGW